MKRFKFILTLCLLIPLTVLINHFSQNTNTIRSKEIIIFRGKKSVQKVSQIRDKKELQVKTTQNLERIYDDKKLILLWTGFFGGQSLGSWGISPGLIEDCPVKCDYSADHNDINKADMVVFLGINDINKYGRPKFRTPDQIWTFFLLESPIYSTIQWQGWNSNVFNWTATYRLDSDAVFSYGQFDKIPQIAVSELDKIIEMPTLESIKDKKLVSWMVSHCHTSSQRETIVEELQKFVQVDVFGLCGPNKCPTNEMHKCFQNLGKNYKFYISFENSLCHDYITEKFFKPFEYSMVPVVYGGGNYSQVAPPNSYINIEDFNSIQELAEYLQFLDENPEEYLKYFEWKKEYIVRNDYFAPGFCNLCTKLHNPTRKSYENLDKWIKTKSDGSDACLKGKILQSNKS